MAKTAAKVLALATWAACFVANPVAAALAQEVEMPVSRIRSEDRSIAALVEEALAHSPTFRRLVANVETSDGIVYVESGQCPGRVAACLLNWMKSSGGNRFLRVVVDRRRIGSECELIVSIGHELQHVVEVLGDRFVTDGRKMFLFYQRYAPTTQNLFETQAAAKVEVSIRSELRLRRVSVAP